MSIDIDGIIWEADADTLCFTRVEGSVDEILGYSATSWLDSPNFWESKLHPDDADWVVETCKEASRKRLPHRLTYRMVAADGRTVWMQDNVKVKSDGSHATLTGVMIDVTELMLQQRELAAMTARNSRFRMLYDLVPVAIWEEDWSELLAALRSLRDQGVDDVQEYAQKNPGFVDQMLARLNLVSVNRAAVEMFRAKSAEDLINRSREVFLANDQFTVFISALDAILQNENEIEGVNNLRRLNGEEFHVMYRIALPDIDELEACAVICEMDISAAHTTSERFLLAAQVAGLGVWDFQRQTKEHNWSPVLREMLGIAEDVPVDPQSLLNRVHPEDRAVFGDLVNFSGRSWDGPTLSRTLRYTRLGESEMRWFSVGAWQIPGEGGVLSRVVAVVRDVTEEKMADDQLVYAATHDSLTALPNREYFVRLLEETVVKSKCDQKRVGLLILDVDHLKTVNDTYGHDVGDALLSAFALRLRTFLEGDEFVARLGGDEFALLVPDASEKGLLARVALRIQNAMAEPFKISEVTISCRPSIGGCRLNSQRKTAQELMKGADLALYAAKASHRGGFVMFQQEMMEEIRQRHSKTDFVREALMSDRLTSFYQPKVDLQTGQVIGLEAIMCVLEESGHYRLVNKSRALLDAPDIAAKIPVRILNKALQDVRAWLDLNIEFGSIALNVGEAELRDQSFAARLLESLKELDIPVTRIQIEIVESVFLGRGVNLVKETVKELNAAGVIIALDDFGTGYAALSHLQLYPVDIIKIDRSFIQGIGEGRGNRAIISAILGLGQSFGLDVVAEGIDTQFQAQFLREAGCRLGQGSLFSLPVPASEVPQFFIDGAANYKTFTTAVQS